MAGNKKALNETPNKIKNAKISQTRKWQGRKPGALRAKTDERQQEKNRECRRGRADVGKQVKRQKEKGKDTNLDTQGWEAQ